MSQLKLLEHGSISGGAVFYDKGDKEELELLRNRLMDDHARVPTVPQRPSPEVPAELQAIFCEHPTNPLLNIPPLMELAALAREHRIPLVVDDTVGFGFWSLLDEAQGDARPDIVVSSLSKVFSGAGNCMGGALMLNRDSPMYDELKRLVDAQYEPALAHADAVTLLHNSSTLPERLRTIAANTLALTEYLESHPLVKTVHCVSTLAQPSALRVIDQSETDRLLAIIRLPPLPASKKWRRAWCR